MAHGINSLIIAESSKCTSNWPRLDKKKKTEQKIDKEINKDFLI